MVNANVKIIRYAAIVVAILLAGIIAYFYFVFQFWTHLDTRHFTALVEYESSHVKGYRGQQVLIHNSFLPIIEQIDAYAIKENVKIIITQSFRPSGKVLTDTIVPPARMSNHLAGHAVDFNVKLRWRTYDSKVLKKDHLAKLPSPVQRFIDSVRKDKTIRWGGDFENEDPIHLDDELNRKNRKLWKINFIECHDDYREAKPKWRLWFR